MSMLQAATSCWTISVASDAVMLAVTLVALLDTLFREVPMDITKARALGVPLIACRLVYNLFDDQSHLGADAARIQGSCLIAHLVFMLPMVVYFLEILVNAWRSAAALRDIDEEHFSWFLKLSPHFRVLIAVYGICLLVAFQLSPTNQLIIGFEVGMTIIWILGVALTVSAARIGVLLHRVRKQTTKDHGPDSVAEIRSIERNILLFVVLNGPAASLAGIFSWMAIFAIADEPAAPWSAPPCEDNMTLNIFKYAAMVAILFMTRAPHSKKRVSLLSSFLSSTRSDIDEQPPKADRGKASLIEAPPEAVIQDIELTSKSITIEEIEPPSKLISDHSGSNESPAGLSNPEIPADEHSLCADATEDREQHPPHVHTTSAQLHEPPMSA